ncbi:MAG: hypothetical protein KAS76_00350 [Thermoplasmatales archaeon]|nr:hypothetical protein [Thermoplasmatales archaeon]MCK4995422.1 hypothetical protein [Thermoplasmatales archaeon]MCK5636076.1 hypothetical protein [Thermoplasmatales archaeon]
MNKKKIKVVLILATLIISISALSGCIAANAIQTKHWDHVNSEGTSVRLWGFLILGENFHNWDGYFVYDTEMHDNWEHYEHTVEADNYDSFNFFSADIDGLDRATQYHYRAVGEHKAQGATIRVGLDHTFIPGGPRVVVYNPSTIGVTSAILEGELTHMGGAASCDVYFKYGTDPDNFDLQTSPQTMTSTGNYNAEITGLTSCQIYYYRAVATNDVDTWDSIFTLHVTAGTPAVETYLPNDVTTTSARFRGELFNLGGTSTCDVWFEYGDENPNQLDETTDPIELSEIGQFDITEDGLTPDITYWVRAVANNGVCEHKGAIKEFKTLGGLEDIEIQSDDVSEEGRLPVVNRILSYLMNRYNIDEERLGIMLEQYPMIKRILG